MKWADGGMRFHPENCALIDSINTSPFPPEVFSICTIFSFFSRWYLLVQNKTFSVFFALVVLYLKSFKPPD